MTPEDEGRVRETLLPLFTKLDEDHSGLVSTAELRTMVDLLQLTLSDAELEAMVASADPDGNGQLSFDEFVQAIHTQMRQGGGSGGPNLADVGLRRGSRRRLRSAAFSSSLRLSSLSSSLFRLQPQAQQGGGSGCPNLADVASARRRLGSAASAAASAAASGSAASAAASAGSAALQDGVGSSSSRPSALGGRPSPVGQITREEISREAMSAYDTCSSAGSALPLVHPLRRPPAPAPSGGSPGVSSHRSAALSVDRAGWVSAEAFEPTWGDTRPQPESRPPAVMQGYYDRAAARRAESPSACRRGAPLVPSDLRYDA